MISIKLYGGLGNQMFQYAFIRSIANKRKCRFNVDVSNHVQASKGGKVDLQLLNVQPEVFQSCSSLSRDLFILRVLKKLGVHRVGKLYIEKTPQLIEAAMTNSCDYFFGYFQSFRYFDQYRDVLINEFTFSHIGNSGFYATIKETESVGIHIRRGDYISDKRVSKVMCELGLDYYRAAAKKISSIIEKPLHFFIFSNDLNWAEQNLVPAVVEFGKYTLVDHTLEPKNLYDFECLKNCKHQIIANSTFSWWAAYLNNYQGKKVIAPLKWYRKLYLDLKDLYPQDFILLK